MDATEKFAQAIRARRLELKMSQEDVANKVGTRKQIISNYEIGKRSPQIDMARRIAEALDMSIDDIYGEPTGDDYEKMLNAISHSLPPEGKMKLLERAEELSVLYGGKYTSVSNKKKVAK